MISYADLSAIYDQWQEKNDASKWADHVGKILLRHCKMTEGDGTGGSFLLLDLGCGTGSFALEMSKRGFDVLGIDRSADMLAIAREKEGARNIQFIQQDMTKMELFGTVDIIVCFLDTINHVLDDSKLRRLFRRCKNYLNPDGLLIFDIATPYYFEQVLGNQVFYDIRESYTLIWQNSVDMAKNRNRADLTFFIRQEDQTYLRGEERIEERIYTPGQIGDLIRGSGLVLLKQYGGLTFRSPSVTSERIVFVAENSRDDWKRKLGTISMENRGKQRKNDSEQ